MGEIQVGKMILSCTERENALPRSQGRGQLELWSSDHRVVIILAVNPWCTPVMSKEAVPIPCNFLISNPSTAAVGVVKVARVLVLCQNSNGCGWILEWVQAWLFLPWFLHFRSLWKVVVLGCGFTVCLCKGTEGKGHDCDYTANWWLLDW